MSSKAARAASCGAASGIDFGFLVSRAGCVAVMDGLQLFNGDVGIYLGRGFELGVAEHGLQETDVCPAFQHVRGAGMAQQMRRTRLVDARILHVAV